MGAARQLYGMNEDQHRRVLALLDYEGDEDPDEELLMETDEQRGAWHARRGDGVSWDVIHWALTGTRSDVAAGDPPVWQTQVFGIDPANKLATTFFGDDVWLLAPRETEQLARTLAEVDDKQMRQRLEHLPSDDEVYRAEGFHARVNDPRWNEMQDTLADARDLVSFVRSCADDDLGLLLFIS